MKRERGKHNTVKENILQSSKGSDMKDNTYSVV